MKLFTKEIDQKLFDQYMMGSNLEDQMVVAKIFNPYGNGVWYLLNSDPSDPDYLWAIVDLFEVEMGSVSREELETLKVPPFRLGLERDLYFTPMNAKKLYDSLLKGEKFEDGGTIDIKKDKSGESWVFPNNPQGETYGIKLAAGGMTAGRWYKDNSGQELRYIGESQGKLLFNDGEKIVTKSDEDFEDSPKEKKLFGFFADGGKTQSKRYKVNVYYGGEMEDEEFYTDSLDEAERASQGGEHSEIYDNHKKEFVEIEYAKGGNVKLYDKNEEWRLSRPSGSIEKDVLSRVQQSEEDFVGNFGWKTSQGKTADGYLYKLNDFDQDLVKDIKLKDGEKIYRYFNRTSAIGGMKPLIKINVDKELLYFLVDTDSDNIAFETKGIQALWIALIEHKMAKGGGVGFTPYGETKGIYKVYYKADGKPQTEIWETKEMAVNTAKRYSSPQMAEEFSNVKVFDEDGSEVDYTSEVKYAKGGKIVGYEVQYDKLVDGERELDIKSFKTKEEAEKFAKENYGYVENVYEGQYEYEKGGETETKQLVVLKADDEKGGNVFVSEEVVSVEDLDDAKSKVKKFVSQYNLNDKTFTGGRYFKLTKKYQTSGNVTSTDVKSQTLGNIDYKGDFTPTSSKMAKGGRTKFKDKVQSIKASLLKRKKVSPKVQKDYGKTYSPKEAEESAKRIVGSMVKKEKRQPRVSKMLEKMKKGTQLNKKKSTFKDRMKELSNKIKEKKSKTTK
jgi:hypothetical protein